MTQPDFDISGIDAGEFARMVTDLPDEQISEIIHSDLRGQILDEIFRRMEDHFDAAKSHEVEEIVHFAITGDADGGENKYQVIITDGTCTVSKDLDQKPGLTLTLDGVSFLKLAADVIPGMTLYLDGKLKIDGNMIKATRLTGLFAMPTAGDAPASETAAQGGQ